MNGKGLGDDVVIALTKVLDKLPSVDTLLLRDNRLTDDSLLELCEKVTHMPNITRLDISYNKIDESSKSILEYLQVSERERIKTKPSVPLVPKKQCAVHCLCSGTNDIA